MRNNIGCCVYTSQDMLNLFAWESDPLKMFSLYSTRPRVVLCLYLYFMYSLYSAHINFIHVNAVVEKVSSINITM